MKNKNSHEQSWGHYGLNFILANDEATVIAMVHLMEKRNQDSKKDKPVQITPKWRKQLKQGLAERMRIRRHKENERRNHFYR